jgi:hypothetical protein
MSAPRYQFVVNISVKIKKVVIFSLPGIASMAIAIASQLLLPHTQSISACPTDIKSAIQKNNSYPSEPVDALTWARHPEVSGLQFHQMPKEKRQQYLPEWHNDSEKVKRCRASLKKAGKRP